MNFFDANLPDNYEVTSKGNNLNETENFNGKEYTLIGESIKTLSFPDRIWEGVNAFAKTVFTLGFAVIFNQGCREDWKSFWTGKSVVIVYGSNILSYQIGAQISRATALRYFGLMYHSGEGVTQSSAEAVKYYKLAADQGDTIAQLCLGVMYYSGEGVTQSNAEAVKYYKLAADQGCELAKSFLDMMPKSSK